MSEVRQDDRDYRDVSTEVEPAPRRSTQEVLSRDTVDYATQRLAANGATLDEIEDFRAAWDDWDDAAEGLSRYQFVRLDDAAIVRLIADGRAEWVAHTHTEDEQAAAEHAAKVQGLHDEAATAVASTIQVVEDWVGDDPARAEAAYYAEQETSNPRVTLLRDLAKTAGIEHGD